jgi:DHA2 family multidrug resistance protein
MAGGVIYQELNQQASALAYQDIYRLLSWMAMGMVACAFLLNKNRPGQGASAENAVH